jgi:hypothetical protein
MLAASIDRTRGQLRVEPRGIVRLGFPPSENLEKGNKEMRKMLIAGLSLSFCVVVFMGQAHGQPSSLPAQKIGETRNGTEVYRFNLDGCELFVAEHLESNSNNYPPATIAMATGRGCK